MELRMSKRMKVRGGRAWPAVALGTMVLVVAGWVLVAMDQHWTVGFVTVQPAISLAGKWRSACLGSNGLTVSTARP